MDSKDFVKRWAFSCWWKPGNDSANVTSFSRLFYVHGPTTGKARNVSAASIVSLLHVDQFSSEFCQQCILRQRSTDYVLKSKGKVEVTAW